MNWIFILLIYCFIQNSSQHFSTDFFSLDSDSNRPLDELITSRGYFPEIHKVKTRDGYILSLYRIKRPSWRWIFGIFGPGKKIKPVLLQHGLLAAGHDWVLSSAKAGLPDELVEKILKDDGIIPKGEGDNLAYVLTDLGYDVWISNTRGNIYSREHEHLDPDVDREYWRYSFDEMILLDCPAVIDYILKTTERENLAVIGHSQGGLMMFGLLATFPDYSEKIKPFIAMAPAPFVGNTTYIFRAMSRSVILESMLSHPKEMMSNRLVSGMVSDICEQNLAAFCKKVIDYVFFEQIKNLDPTRLSAIVPHYPSGTSTVNIVHWGQIIRDNQFQMYDFGGWENVKKYGVSSPPIYDLSNINSRNISILWGGNDLLVNPKDIRRLIKSLKVPIREYRVPKDDWSHVDFVLGKDAGFYLHNEVVAILRHYT